MEGDEPQGGQWNYDAENRSKFKKTDLAKIPAPLVFENDYADVLDRLQKHQVNHFGKIGDSIVWPVNRKQSLQLLDFFCEHCLPYFGKFQDAMTSNSPHAWSLYHSRLSFALNAKMLNPLQVVSRAISEFESRPDEISLCLLYTSPSPRDKRQSRMPSSA